MKKIFTVIISVITTIFLFSGCTVKNTNPSYDDFQFQLIESDATQVADKNTENKKEAEVCGEEIETTTNEKDLKTNTANKNENKNNVADTDTITKEQAQEEPVKENIVDDKQKNENIVNTKTSEVPAYPAHSPTTIETEVLNLINTERAKEGISPLIYYGKTYVCAEKRAKESMLLWSHTRPNGKPSYTVYEEFGFVLEVRAGENLAKNFTTAEQIVAKLMTSEGHRKNIMQPEYHRVCICITTDENGMYYMSQLFLG